MAVAILKLGSNLLTSLQADLTDEEALEFQSDLLNRLYRAEVTGVVIDITALDVVDSYMARLINDTANMAKLMGVAVVVSGMQPTVALTLIEMGRELIGVEASLDLEQGVEKLNVIASAEESGPDGEPSESHV